MKVGLDRGRFVRIADGQFYHVETVQTLQQTVRDYLANTAVSRSRLSRSDSVQPQFALTALEYFDSIRLTRRIGDERTLY